MRARPGDFFDLSVPMLLGELRAVASSRANETDGSWESRSRACRRHAVAAPLTVVAFRRLKWYEVSFCTIGRAFPDHVFVSEASLEGGQGGACIRCITRTPISSGFFGRGSQKLGYVLARLNLGSLKHSTLRGRHTLPCSK